MSKFMTDKLQKSFSDQLYIGAQLNLADLPALKQAGITHILCHRPDGEEINQTDFIAIQKEAKKLNIIAQHCPFSGKNIDKSIIDATKNLLQDKSANLYFYCRSGTRSALAWFDAMIELGEDANKLHQIALENGYDLRKFR